jgi:hypothetical protein
MAECSPETSNASCRDGRLADENHLITFRACLHAAVRGAKNLSSPTTVRHLTQFWRNEPSFYLKSVCFFLYWTSKAAAPHP